MAILQSGNLAFYHPGGHEIVKTYPSGFQGDETIFSGPESDSFTTGKGDFLQIDSINTSGFVLAYRDVGAGDLGRVRFGSVDGTDIELGPVATFHNDLTVAIDVKKLDESKIVVTYRKHVPGNDSTPRNSAARIGTVSGTNITFGAEEEFYIAGTGSPPGFTSWNNIAVLDSTKFVVAYWDVPDTVPTCAVP